MTDREFVAKLEDQLRMEYDFPANPIGVDVTATSRRKGVKRTFYFEKQKSCLAALRADLGRLDRWALEAVGEEPASLAGLGFVTKTKMLEGLVFEALVGATRM